METDSARPGSALFLPALAGLPGLRLFPCIFSGRGPAPGMQRREVPWLERAGRALGTHTLQCPARRGVVFSLWCHRGGALFQKSPLLRATGCILSQVCGCSVVFWWEKGKCWLGRAGPATWRWQHLPQRGLLGALVRLLELCWLTQALQSLLGAGLPLTSSTNLQPKGKSPL